MSIILPPGAMPTLPSTNLRAEVGAVIKANIKQLLTDILVDRISHARAIAGGPVLWRELFVREMGPHWGNTRGDAGFFADLTYDCIKRAWIDKYPDITPERFLDKVHVPSPESEKEREQAIEDAWRVEIASDERSMAQHYYGSARVRTGRDAFSSFWNKPQDRKPS